MKKPVLSFMASVCLGLSCAFAQDTVTVSRTIFKLSPQHFIHNSLKAGVERFNRNHTASIALFVTGMMSMGDGFNSDGYNGLAGELQLRKYISPLKKYTSRNGKVYYQGVYGAAYAQGGSYSGDFKYQYTYFDPTTGGTVTQTEYDYHESIGNWGVGFTIGYQKTLWQVIFLEAFVGGGIQFADRIVSGLQPDPGYYYYDGIIDPGYKGILPKIGLNIGIGL